MPFLHFYKDKNLINVKEVITFHMPSCKLTCFLEHDVKKEKWRFGRYMPNFLKTRIRLLRPRCHLCSVSAIAGCYMKYQILRYFNNSCSLGRNDRLSGVGV